MTYIAKDYNFDPDSIDAAVIGIASELNAHDSGSHKHHKAQLLYEVIGYVNASWTLKVDVVADYICRLFKYMDKNGFDEVIAPTDHSAILDETVMGEMSSGYIARAAAQLPKQGSKAPWMATHNYLTDRKDLKNAKFNDGILKFSKLEKHSERKPQLVS